MNYFNYFTEIEEHFQRKRGAQLYLSPVDWALIASWREAGIPLEAVLAGVDRAFEKFDAGTRPDWKRHRSMVYCAAAVAEAAEAMAEAAVGAPPAAGVAEAPPAEDAFSRERIVAFLERADRQLSDTTALDVAGPAVTEIRAALGRLMESLRGTGATAAASLEEIDRVLTVLDDKLLLALQQAVGVDEMVGIRAEMDRELAPHRRKLRPEQLAMIERQCVQRRLLERARLPRLSLFYMP